MHQYTASPLPPRNPLRPEHLGILRARSLARVTHRAQALLAGGGCAVTGPFPVARYQGFALTTAAGAEFSITLSATPGHPVFGDLCTCAAFEEYGECEHHLAILMLLRDKAFRKAREDALRREDGRFPYPFTDAPGDGQ